MYLKDVSTRKDEKVVAELDVESMGKDRLSRICANLDEEAASFCGRTFDGIGFLYL